MFVSERWRSLRRMRKRWCWKRVETGEKKRKKRKTNNFIQITVKWRNYHFFFFTLHRLKTVFYDRKLMWLAAGSFFLSNQWECSRLQQMQEVSRRLWSEWITSTFCPGIKCVREKQRSDHLSSAPSSRTALIGTVQIVFFVALHRHQNWEIKKYSCGVPQVWQTRFPFARKVIFLPLHGNKSRINKSAQTNNQKNWC